MREILFRAWIDGDVYYLGDENAHMFWEDGQMGVTYMSGILEGTDAVYNTIFDGFILEQYTGLKDKNGKMIFEGDVVKVVHTDYGTNREHVAAIEYHQCNFCLRKLRRGFNVWLGTTAMKDIEIIGNIHDNPELLEAK